jgi:gluconolactonase
MKRILPLIGFCLPLMSFAADEKPMAPKMIIERFDPAFDQLVAADAKVEKLAEGYTWSEGPVWFKGAVLFSDVPKNVVTVGPKA